MHSPLSNNIWLLFAVNEFGVIYYTASPWQQLTDTNHVMMLVGRLESEFVIQGTAFDHLSATCIVPQGPSPWPFQPLCNTFPFIL